MVGLDVLPPCFGSDRQLAAESPEKGYEMTQIRTSKSRQPIVENTARYVENNPRAPKFYATPATMLHRCSNFLFRFKLKVYLGQ